MGWYGLDLPMLGQGAVEGSCEHGNEPSGSINGLEFQLLSDLWLLKDSVPWSCLDG
jgi:hypothetical protein